MCGSATPPDVSEETKAFVKKGNKILKKLDTFMKEGGKVDPHITFEMLHALQLDIEVAMRTLIPKDDVRTELIEFIEEDGYTYVWL